MLAVQAEELRQNGATAIFVAVDGQLAGLIAIADPIKSTTAQALQDLKTERATSTALCARAVCQGDDEQHPAKSIFRFRLQCRRCTDRRRRPLSSIEAPPVARDCGGGDGVELGERDRQFLAASHCKPARPA